jgi:hypothetical protein
LRANKGSTAWDIVFRQLNPLVFSEILLLAHGVLKYKWPFKHQQLEGGKPYIRLRSPESLSQKLLEDFKVDL